MRRRYYADDDFEIGQFLAWGMILGGVGVAEVVKWLTRPGAYTPDTPDNPTQVTALFEHVPKVDWTQAKLPKFNLGNFKPPTKISGFEDIKKAAKDVLDEAWSPEDRPQIIPRSEVKRPFQFPEIVGEPRAFRIAAAKVPSDPEASTNLIIALMSATPRLTFEIVADGSETIWQIADYEGRYPPQIIIDHIRTHHSGAKVEVVDALTLPERQYPFHRQLLVFGLANEYAAPLPFFRELKGNDPIATLTRRMDFLDPAREERVHYQLFSIVRTFEASDRAGKRLMRGTVRPTSGIIEDKSDPLSGFDIPLLNAKIDSPLYHTFLAVTVESRDEQRLIELAQIAHDVMQVSLPRYNRITLVGSREFRRTIENDEQASIAWLETLLTALVQSSKSEWRRLLCVLSPQEMATLWHLPDETFAGERIVWATSAVPTELVGTEGVPHERVVIGDAALAGKHVPIAMAATDRDTHIAIAGKPKVGKSTLLLNLIHQDIEAGRGVAVIDPHGKLIDDILRRSIRAERHNDVVLLDCGRNDYPAPINPFRIPPGVEFYSAFNYVYWVTRRIYEDIWLDGQTDMVMRNVIQALLCDPEATPLDIRRLFMSDAYRQHVIDLMSNHDKVSLDVLDFWIDFKDRSTGDKREIARPVLNRTSAFLGNRTLELMTCHPTGFNFQECIREQKIVLINLAGDEIANEQGSLGAMFLSGFYLASETFKYVDDGAPPRFYVYVDEVERFITSPLKDMFSQARKFGLSLTMANQFLAQLSKETLQTLFGTVGTQFLFELGAIDAPTFAPSIEPDVPAESLLQLGLHRMVVKTRAAERTLPAFVVSTRDMPEGTGTPYAREERVPDFMSGDAVRAWLMERRQRDIQPTEQAPTQAADGSGGRKVTDFE